MPADAGPPAPPPELRFTPSDVEHFAAASGDRNPLHVDNDFARRTPFGERIVHGALVTIGMLGALPDDELTRIRALRAWFAGPVIPGAATRVTANASPQAPGSWEIRLIGRGKPLARLLAGPTAERIAPGLADAAAQAGASAATGIPMRTEPAEPTAGELETGRIVVADYRPGQGLAALAAQFGAQALDPALLDGLAWASYVVGMEMPGLHSLFSGLRLAIVEAGAGGARARRYRIELRDHDPRTGQLGVEGVLTDGSGAPLVAAKIECFVRAPTGAPDPAALAPAAGARATRTAPDLGTAVVIGASRGFGAALSLALVGRGYRVEGAHSSAGSGAELATLGGARLRLHRLDAADPAQMATLAAAVGPDQIAGLALNAALPPLPMGLDAESARDLAEYVAASVMLAAAPLAALLSLVDGDVGWVMFSSSSALGAPPRDWPHYVTAKAALEGLARWVAEISPGLRTVILRPPAMRTEMTNTPSGRIAPVATETIAGWVADRLAGDQLPAGLSTLEPGTVAPR